jgi:hypothetical protein
MRRAETTIRDGDSGFEGAGYFVKFDKIWPFYRVQRRLPEKRLSGEKDSLTELALFRTASKTQSVASGTQFRLLELMKGLARLGWGRSSLGVEVSFARAAAGSGVGFGAGSG